MTQPHDAPLTDDALRRGLAGLARAESTPIAAMLEHLDGCEDAAALVREEFQSLLRREVAPAGGNALSMSGLSSAREAALTAVASAKSEEARARGTLSYLLAVAGGAAWHGAALSSVERTRLAESFEDIRTAARLTPDHDAAAVLDAAIRWCTQR